MTRSAQSDHFRETAGTPEPANRPRTPQRLKRKAGAFAFWATAALAAATVIVPAIAAEHMVPGCKVTVKSGDSGDTLAVRSNTPIDTFRQWNPDVSARILKGGEQVTTATCGDLGKDHKVEPIED